MPLGNVPVAILLCDIAALPLMSASTIVPSCILAEVIDLSLTSAVLIFAVALG